MLDEVELKRLGAALDEPLAPGEVAMILRLGGGFRGFLEWWSAHKAGWQSPMQGVLSRAKLVRLVLVVWDTLPQTHAREHFACGGKSNRAGSRDNQS